MKGLASPPVHIHDDINGRLSRTSFQALDAVEKWAAEQVLALNNDKANQEALGNEILEKYLAVLSREHAFLTHGMCHQHPRKTCPLPHTSLKKLRMKHKKLLSMNVSGTECYDVSSMGRQRGLTGQTARTLALWIAQRRLALEAGAACRLFF